MFRPRHPAALLIAWLVAQPSTALGWTRAQIHGAQAHVELVDDATAQVALTIQLRITGGWLSELELPGLAADIVPDIDKPASVIAVTGEKYAPHLVLDHGIWRITFADKHSAPWRGDYTVMLLYREPLNTQQMDSTTRRVHWTMPPWRLGMEEPRIWISAPNGSRPVQSADANVFGTETTLSVRGRTLITHRRSQLPRDTQWAVAVDVPVIAPVADIHDASATLPTPRTSTAIDVRSDREWLPESVWLPAWILLLACLKRRLSSALALRRRCSVRPLIPLPGLPHRAALAFTLTALGGLLWHEQASVAAALWVTVVLLTIDRSFDHEPATATRWCAVAPVVQSYRVRIREWLGPHGWMDVTTPTGATTLMCAYAAMLMIARLDLRQSQALTVLALLLTPLWTTGTRLHMPWDGERIGRVLTEWSQRNRNALAPSLAHFDGPLLCLDHHDAARDARLPLRFQHPVSGLDGVDLTLVTDARSLRRRVALLAQACEGSAADLVLHQVPNAARRVILGSVLYVVPPEHIMATIRNLAMGAPARDVGASELDRAAA